MAKLDADVLAAAREKIAASTPTNSAREALKAASPEIAGGSPGASIRRKSLYGPAADVTGPSATHAAARTVPPRPNGSLMNFPTESPTRGAIDAKVTTRAVPLRLQEREVGCLSTPITLAGMVEPIAERYGDLARVIDERSLVTM